MLDPKTGQLDAYLNKGPDPASASQGWAWEPIGSIATGLGRGADIRFADIDGEGVSNCQDDGDQLLTFASLVRRLYFPSS